MIRLIVIRYQDNNDHNQNNYELIDKNAKHCKNVNNILFMDSQQK